jgi:hypothetical protein
MTVVRAIYSGMGIADDPDIDDYYSRARGFPLTYSPDDDPEVVEEMRIAAAELKKGSDDSEDDATKGSESLNDDETDSGEGKGGAEEDWADEDGPSKRNQKTLSSVDKVRVSYHLV